MHLPVAAPAGSGWAASRERQRIRRRGFGRRLGWRPSRAWGIPCLIALASLLIVGSLSHTARSPRFDGQRPVMLPAAQFDPVSKPESLECPAGAASIDDTEPNDDLTTATDIAPGAFCATGTGDGTDDTFLWEVTAVETSQLWDISFQRSPGQYSTVRLERIEPLEGDANPRNGTTRQVFYQSVTDDEQIIERDLMLAEGYYLVIIQAGSVPEAGEYQFVMTPSADLPERSTATGNADIETAAEVTGAFALRGDRSETDDYYVWRLDSTDSTERWRLRFQAPLGVTANAILQDESQITIVSVSSDEYGRGDIYDLGLEPGTYYLRIPYTTSPPGDYTLALEPDGVRETHREEEPNDDLTTAFPFDPHGETIGRLAGRGDRDMFLWEVDTATAARLNDVVLTTEGESIRTLCLIANDGTEIKCGDTDTSGVVQLVDLFLPAGSHALMVKGDPDPDALYTLRVEVGDVPSPGQEYEPNDSVALAVPATVDQPMRGRFFGREADVFRYTLDGEPEVWRVTVEGTGIERIQYLNAQNTRLAEASFDPFAGTASFATLLLPPGDAYFAITGADGDYILSLESLGPPDPLSEREPNDQPGLADALVPGGEPRNGHLATNDDVDYFRFTISQEERVALRITPPSDGAIRFHLEWGADRLGQGQSPEIGAELVYDALLPPGDYFVMLRAISPSLGRYEIELERGDPFSRPADLEPNNTAAQARPLPDTLEATGRVGVEPSADDDWYVLPMLDTPSLVTIEVTQGDTDQVRLGAAAIDETLTTTDLAILDEGVVEGPNDRTTTTYSVEQPAGQRVAIGLRGRGEYDVSVRYANGPEPIAQPPAPPITLAVTTDVDVVAAYLEVGQRVLGEVIITNKGLEPVSVALDAVASEFTWRLTLEETDIPVPANDSITVPMLIEVAPDAREGFPVQLAVRTQSAAGGGVSAWATLAVDADVAPVDPFQMWAVPEPLLGGLDVAWGALGAEVVIDPFAEPDVTNDAHTLFNAMTTVGTGWSPSFPVYPLELTIDLAGDDPAPVVGFILNPLSRQTPSSYARDFEVWLSEDGVKFTLATVDELSPWGADQYFVLDEPVEASYARLRVLSTWDVSAGHRVPRASLGLWRVIVEPGWTPTGDESPAPVDTTQQANTNDDASRFPPGAVTPNGLNIADPRVGGHLVWSDPLYSSIRTANKEILVATDRATNVGLQPGEEQTLIFGFHHNRAALITTLDWRNPSGVDETRNPMMTEARVQVSLESPIGPWIDVGAWDAVAGPGEVATVTLDEPTWARFVRITFQAPASDATSPTFWTLPDRIRIFEAPQSDEYRSIIGEWGLDTREGIYEVLAPPVVATDEGIDAGNTPEDATPLNLDEEVSGQVHVQVDVDWFEIEVPEGNNTLSFTLTGEPAIGVAVTVLDENGLEITITTDPRSQKERVYQAEVAPGRYRIGIEQPPTSIIFAYDTSGSVGGYHPAIQRSVASYAAEVTPGREAANFLPFEASPLLPEFSDDPITLQRAFTNDPGLTGSSAAERSLLDASNVLLERDGTRAVILITDAESGPEMTELWRSMEQSQIRVYSVFLDGGGDLPGDQAVMQDWANVNGGAYSYIRNESDMDIAFARAAVRLRRPASYTLVARASNEAPPAPGTITVVSGALGSPGASTPPVASGAVHIIFDTSGSMLQDLSGETRIDIARRTLRDLVVNTIPPGTPFALRTFDVVPDSCDTLLVIPLAPHDPEAAASVIDNIPVVNLVRTPLSASLLEVERDLAGVEGPRLVVLITDGEETCGGDPAEAIRQLRESGIDVRINIVGFALNDPALDAQFEEWAALGGGAYFSAGDSSELTEALSQALRAPFSVVDQNGEIVATGIVDGEPVEVPAGIYTVVIATAEPIVLEDVVVPAGGATEVEVNQEDGN